MRLKGTGVVASTDYKDVKWVGKTKGGKAVTIKLKNALNMGNLDWTFAEKNETVANIVFTATYNNTDSTSDSEEEPWEIEIADSVTDGAASILLGVGIFYIGNTQVALNRGGGQFTVTREYRQIAADGDRGPVKDRVVIDSSTATLAMNVLSIMNRVCDLYAAVKEVEENE